ncbi:hypothetical protein [Rhodocyclus tenuis]|uniref:Uncharacterized protein n=1 Tax=Rhodocyclus tenuis TaxID=1066 RepID=A0A840G0E3_RHOTE|nr:hypothetical protein [Rhodocyclus tenuis]MBB4247867.1 hypothetical protein [Rhodocyclus tenuis]
MARPVIEAVTAQSLPEFAAFLSANMSIPRSPEAWGSALSANWLPERPNYGFLLRAGEDVVGGIGALYAERKVRGQSERFCNITSWCVRDDFRRFSVALAMQLLAQPGYHFTDFSPTKVVAGTLQFLKFQSLDDAVVVLPGLPVHLGNERVLDDAVAIGQEIPDELRQAWQDHSVYPWLRQLLLGRPGAWCHLIYKLRDFKGMPAAQLIYRSDRELLNAGLGALQTYFCRRGILSVHIERRMLGRTPKLGVLRSGFNPKQFNSSTLLPDDIDYLYSESVSMDL